ncbi:LysR family transcriptional regulator [Sphingomonas sp. TDK1]|uniref:LysR family transcriptional regulator n=1 Tax=Sphingomonas sp. TDK1 TaxID=453247 RepID=UPI0007D97AF6|nr:LysR family transcriptional regulator [Sphingomonas sp. TDK1]OAN58517.1 LysR family transcriptional regulator [Sphingomonas sp. TDK1]
MRQWAGIEEFVAVARTGSFTAGAARLGMSPTHVSRAIIAIEQRLDAQLLYRTTRTVRLTDTGRAFLERCERILRERDEAFALVGGKGEPQGELRVTCSTTMGERFVAPILRRWSIRHPRLSLNIELTNRVIDLVAEDFDLAIRTGSVDDPRLTKTRVASRTLYTCAAPTYLARRGTPRDIADLAEHECIIGSASTWHFRATGQAVLHRPTGSFRCNSGHAVIEACVSGLGICQLPDFYILPYLQHGMVRLVLPEAQAADEPIWAVYPQHRHLLPKVQQAVATLVHELAAAMNQPHLRDLAPA